jgi:FtsH-binding integral membrane protein
MSDNRAAFPSELGVRPASQLSNQFLVQSFGWMFAGLLLAAGVAAIVLTQHDLYRSVRSLYIPIAFAQLGLGLGIQILMPRLSATLALGLFFVFAATLGFTTGVIVSVYRAETVVTSFVAASAMFGGAAVYGATTRRSLTGLGGFLAMGIFGLIVASIVNLFLGVSPIGWFIALIGVVVFTVYTAYIVQRIAFGDLAARLGSMEKASVLGALVLLISFINIFLFLLRLMGSRR